MAVPLSCAQSSALIWSSEVSKLVDAHAKQWNASFNAVVVEVVCLNLRRQVAARGARKSDNA